jgi:hypothetical protein
MKQPPPQNWLRHLRTNLITHTGTCTYFASCPLSRRFSGNAERRGSARVILGLGLAPGSRQCAALLSAVNGQAGFAATDVSDMDLAQVGAGCQAWLSFSF